MYIDSITYTIYKLNNKYQPVTIMLEKENSELFDLVEITPFGEKELDVGNPETKNIGGINYSIYNLSIPEEYEKYDHQGISKSEIPFIICIYYNLNIE